MTKALKIVVTIVRILSIPGLIIGVIFIILSYNFNRTLSDFKANGTHTVGAITALYDNNNPRYTSYFVDLEYQRSDANGTVHTVIAKRVEVYFKAARKLRVGDELELYYKPEKQSSDLLLMVNYEPDNIPLSRKPWWAWGMAIVSACIAGSYQIGKIFNKRK